MRYGKIEVGFWHSPKVKRLSEDARYLLLYLLSCPHGNLVGCFVIHDGYIAADLGWPIERVCHTLSEVFSAGHAERDPNTFLLRVTGWWGHNTLENPKVAIHATRVIDALPNCEVKQRLIESLICFQERSRKVWETLSKAYRKGMAYPIDNRNRSRNHNRSHSKEEPEQEEGVSREVVVEGRDADLVRGAA